MVRTPSLSAIRSDSAQVPDAAASEEIVDETPEAPEILPGDREGAAPEGTRGGSCCLCDWSHCLTSKCNS